jgi:hypothetical protein
LTSKLCQTIGDELFFTWHIFLEVDKTQDLSSKIWQTFGDALTGSQKTFSTVAYKDFGSVRSLHP